MLEILVGTGLGLTRGEVTLSPSNPAWQTAYEQMAPSLLAALNDLALAVEHIGSTAVPGLPAKPILDIAVGLRPDADRDAVVEALQSVGFLYRGTAEDDEDVNMMFGWEDAPRHRVVNLHVVPHDGRRWHEWLTFRDRLRTDPHARDTYAALKTNLAQKFPTDRKPYITGKNAFVEQILGEG